MQASGYGTGQLPDKEGQMYHCEVDDLYLIPTAEVPVTNIYRDVILEEKQLPIMNCAYTQCFRREAGSYGKDVTWSEPPARILQSRISTHRQAGTLQRISPANARPRRRSIAKTGTSIPYSPFVWWRHETLPLRYASISKYIPKAQKRWLEVSSVSNFDTYQANRLKCRYRSAEKKTELCHTLNGSALALPRIVAALLENNQTPRRYQNT